jgi:hypothetical protein
MENATPYAPVHAPDVHQTLLGLAGTYTSQALYDRYAGIARINGRTPAHPVAVGQELARQGCTRRKVKRKSCWFV